MPQREDENLPKWFVLASKIAQHCTWGICSIYVLLQMKFVNQNLNKQFLQWVYIFLVVIAVPAFIFSGSTIVKIVTRFTKSDDNK